MFFFTHTTKAWKDESSTVEVLKNASKHFVKSTGLPYHSLRLCPPIYGNATNGVLEALLIVARRTTNGVLKDVFRHSILAIS